MRLPVSTVAFTAVVGVAGIPSAHAQVYGSLANFDAVNDTGQIAHGFEIQIEDPSYDHTKLASIFGLDRNFGVPPTSVERYGAPTITDLPGVGVSVRYAATFAAGAWSVGTPTGPYPFAGDSCWPLGNAQYNSGNLTCDHFGVATFGSPANTTYSWLVDPTNSGTLSKVAAGLPPVNFAPQPVPPGNNAPPVVVAEIDAHKENNEPFGKAYWVKVFANHVNHGVEIGDLLKGNAVVPNDQQVETEFEIFQAGNVPGGNGQKKNDLALNPGDEALVVRYEFYKYLGPLSAEGEAVCEGKGGGKGGGGAKVSPGDCGGLGDFVGAQIAGFNQVQPPLAAVPEPQTWALMGAGILSLALRRRGSRASRPLVSHVASSTAGR